MSYFPSATRVMATRGALQADLVDYQAELEASEKDERLTTNSSNPATSLPPPGALTDTPADPRRSCAYGLMSMVLDADFPAQFLPTIA